MTREEFQQTVSERFQNTDSGFGNMTQRELILLQIASNVYENQVKKCSIPYVVGQSEQLSCPKCKSNSIYSTDVEIYHDCHDCGHDWTT